MEIADIPALVARLRETFDFGGTRSLEWRLRQIDGVIRFLETREREIVDAVTKDLGKPQIEAVGAEVTFTLADARHIRKHLAAWMKPDRVASTLPGSRGRGRRTLPGHEGRCCVFQGPRALARSPPCLSPRVHGGVGSPSDDVASTAPGNRGGTLVQA